MKTITVSNSFHGTTARLRVPAELETEDAGYVLAALGEDAWREANVEPTKWWANPRRVQRSLRARLCGSRTCKCSGPDGVR